ncbi:MAG: V-type ATPase subunit [Saccharofermentanales bacterium]
MIIKSVLESKIKGIVTNRQDYAYISARVRSLETGLLSRAAISRLFEANDADDIAKVLTDSGYTITDSIENTVRRDLSDSYALLSAIIPNKEYIDALLLANDYHNLKVILKGFIPDYREDAAARLNDVMEESDVLGHMEEFFRSGGEGFSEQDLSKNFSIPAKYDPLKLLESIRTGRNDLPDPDFKAAVEEAFKRYVRFSDPGEIDIAIDRHYYRRLSDYALMLDNPFFSEYAAFRADSTNLGILLRLRAMKADSSRIAGMTVKGSQIPEDKVAALLNESNESIKDAYRSTSCEELAAFADTYGIGRAAMEFGRAVDNRIIRMLEKTRLILFGPEIMLAYLISKDIQARNINIALTCVRNKVPMNIASEMMRNCL